MNLEQFIERHRQVKIPDDVKQRVKTTVRNHVRSRTPARLHPIVNYAIAAAMSCGVIMAVFLSQRQIHDVKPFDSIPYMTVSFQLGDLISVVIIPEDNSL